MEIIARKNAVPSCADCSGTATHIWECNNTTVGTGGPPCGCSDGDTSASANGDATITSGAAVFDDTGSNNGQDFYAFTVSNDDICDDQLGTVFIRFKVDTWVNAARLFRLYGSNDNFLRVVLESDNDLVGTHEGNNTTETVALSGNATGTGTEYIVRYRWQDGVAGTDHQITLYNTSMGELDNNADDDDITEFTTQAGVGDFRVGNDSNNAGSDINIYYIHVYNEWKETDPNA